MVTVMFTLLYFSILLTVSVSVLDLTRFVNIVQLFNE